MASIAVMDNKFINTKTLGGTTITIQPAQTTSPSYSSLTVSPSVAAFGYNQSVTITFTARDTNNRPIVGRTYIIIISTTPEPNLNAVYTTYGATDSNGTITAIVGVQAFTIKEPGQHTVVVREGATTIKSTVLLMSYPAAQINVTSSKSTYMRGTDNTVTLTAAGRTSSGSAARSWPIYYRIKRPNGQYITPQGSTPAQGSLVTSSTGEATISIPLNTTNFPDDGNYTIEVADNSSFSATVTPAATPAPMLLSQLMTMLLPLLFIIPLIKLLR